MPQLNLSALGKQLLLSTTQAAACAVLGLGSADNPTFASLFIGGSDAKIARGATGPTIDLQAAGGIRSRNLAGNADAPISGSTGTFSGAALSSFVGQVQVGTGASPQGKLEVAGGSINIRGATSGIVLGATAALPNAVCGLYHTTADTTGFTTLFTQLGGVKIGVEGLGAAVTIAKTTGAVTFAGAVTASSVASTNNITGSAAIQLSGVGSSTFGGSVVAGATRPVTLNGNSGIVSIQGAVGGWDIGYKFLGNAGTNKGGFGANGSADSLTYYYVGATYTSPVASFLDASGFVGIGTTQPYTRLDVVGGYVNSSGPTYGFTLGKTTGLPGGVAVLHHSSGDTTGNTQLFTNLGGLRLGVEGNTSALVLAKTTGSATFGGTITPIQATTAGAPAYVKGAIYFDTTLNKLRVGGATAWETITSA